MGDHELARAKAQELFEQEKFAEAFVVYRQLFLFDDSTQTSLARFFRAAQIPDALRQHWKQRAEQAADSLRPGSLEAHSLFKQERYADAFVAYHRLLNDEAEGLSPIPEELRQHWQKCAEEAFGRGPVNAADAAFAQDLFAIACVAYFQILKEDDASEDARKHSEAQKEKAREAAVADMEEEAAIDLTLVIECFEDAMTHLDALLENQPDAPLARRLQWVVKKASAALNLRQDFKDVQNIMLQATQDYKDLHQRLENASTFDLRPIFAAMLAGGGAVAVTPLVIALVGFSVEGVVAGTLAAFWQSMIGNVALSSLFAALQSAGVLGVSMVTNAAIFVVFASLGLGVAWGILRHRVKAMNMMLILVKEITRLDGAAG